MNYQVINLLQTREIRISLATSEGTDGYRKILKRFQIIQL